MATTEDNMPAATIGDLPDALLGAILACLGRHRAAPALLVSKRWRRVFLSEPALWRQFSISMYVPHARHMSEVLLLRRVGSMVTALSAPAATAQEQAAVLAWVPRTQLQQLTLRSPSQQLLSALPSFSSLTKLDLGSLELDPPAGVAAALPHVPQLRSLALAGNDMSARLTAAVMACTQLEELSVETGGFKRPRALRQLSRLTRLRRLQLASVDEETCMELPEPAQLPNLQWYRLTCDELSDVAGVRVAACTMEKCAYAEYDAAVGKLHGGRSVALMIDGEQPAGCLSALLSALRPGDVPAVEGLELVGCLVSAAVLEQCGQLATVRRMGMAYCSSGGDWEAALAALWHQAPLLSSVIVSRCLQGQLPQSLVAHTGLRHLSLVENGLQGLPAGPYLAGLEWLRLGDKALQQLPPALTAASALTGLEVTVSAVPLPADSLNSVLAQLSRLQRLQLTNCGLRALPAEALASMAALRSLELSVNPQLRPTAQQLGALLSRLPLLEELDLEEVGLRELPDHLPPGLRFLSVGENRLQSLPAGLTSSSLTALDITSNPALQLSRAEVDSLLARLPSLCRLPTFGTAFSEDVQTHVTKRLILRRD